PLPSLPSSSSSSSSLPSIGLSRLFDNFAPFFLLWVRDTPFVPCCKRGDGGSRTRKRQIFHHFWQHLCVLLAYQPLIDLTHTIYHSTPSCTCIGISVFPSSCDCN